MKRNEKTLRSSGMGTNQFYGFLAHSLVVGGGGYPVTNRLHLQMVRYRLNDSRGLHDSVRTGLDSEQEVAGCLLTDMRDEGSPSSSSRILDEQGQIQKLTGAFMIGNCERIGGWPFNAE